MRRLALAALSLACAEWRRPPTFPEQAKNRPMIHEQAVVGLSREGNLAAAQLIDADAEAPRLTLLAFGRGGEPTRALLEAAPERAAAVARALRDGGSRRTPLLDALVAKEWPEAAAHAARLGYAHAAPAVPEPDSMSFRIQGARDAGALPLVLRIAQVDEPAPATALLIADAISPDTGIELTRMPLAGAPVRPQLFIQGGIAWLLSGSVLDGPALHRAVGVRRASLARGEAELHNLMGIPTTSPATSTPPAANSAARSPPTRATSTPSTTPRPRRRC